MREAAWQNRIDELEQLLREAEEKVNERDAIFLEGVPTTTTTTTTRKEERKRAQESGRYRSSNRSSSSSISSSNDGKNNNNRLTAEGRRKLTTFAAKLSELSSASSTTAMMTSSTTAESSRVKSPRVQQAYDGPWTGPKCSRFHSKDGKHPLPLLRVLVPEFELVTVLTRTFAHSAHKQRRDP